MTTTTTNQPTPPPVTGVTAHLQLADAHAAVALYQRAFGAEVLATMPAQDGKRIMHGHLRINGGNVFVADGFPEHGCPAVTPQAFSLHLQVDDAEAWWKRAVAAGLSIVHELHVAFWGDKYGQVKDAFGVTWSIGGPNR